MLAEHLRAVAGPDGAVLRSGAAARWPLTISAFIELDQVGPSPERPAIEVRVRGR